MKRWVVPVLLLLGVGGALLLVLQLGDDDRGRRRGATQGVEAGGAGDEEGAEGEEGRPAGADAATPGRAGRDDDPNRVPGPDLLIRGRVLRGEAPVEGAEVTLGRAFPAIGAQEHAWRSRYAEDDPAPPFAATTTDAEGRFAVRIPRRRSLVIETRAKGCAADRLLLFAPGVGDPEEVLIRLLDGNLLRFRVVAPDGTPVPGAAGLLRLLPWRTPPFRFEGTTDDAGWCEMGGLPDGWGELRVTAPGYPVARVSLTVRPRTELQVTLAAGGSIAGTVKDDAGTPLAGATLAFGTGRSWERAGGFATAVTDASGAYRVDSIRPGEVASLSLHHPDYPPLSSDLLTLVPPLAPVRPGEELRHDVVVQAGTVVRGVVVREADGSPVRGAHVALLKRAEPAANLAELVYAVTGDGGEFLFPHVPEGDYALEVWTEGLGRRVVRSQQLHQPMTIDFSVVGKEEPPKQRIVLRATGRVEGRIRNFEGRALANTSVSISAEEYGASTQPDGTGFFLFEGVPPAESAVVNSWMPQIASERFAVRAGTTTKIELDALKQLAFAGIVVDEAGAPVAGAMVQALPSGQPSQPINQWNATRSDHQGRFLAPVQEWQAQQSAKWNLVANHPRYADGVSEGNSAPRPGDPGPPVRIVLPKGGSVTGRVEFADGRPAPGATVSLLAKAQQGVPEFRQPRVAVTMLDGTFEITGVGAGAWYCSAYLVDFAGTQSEVTAGTDQVRLVLTPKEAISGVVLDDGRRPVAQATVNAFAGDPKQQQMRASANTDAAGRFRLTGLAPGTYSVQVTGSNSYGAGPAFPPKTVEQVASGTENLVIEIEPGATVRGRVLDAATGRPLAAAAVIAMVLKIDPKSNPQSAQRPIAWTNGRGEFEMKGVGQEPVELIALAPRYLPSTAPAAPGDRDCTIRLDAGLPLDGRILLPDGSPLANQWVSLTTQNKELQAQMTNWQQRAGQAWNNAGGWQLLQGRTDSLGRFRFLALPPGEYRPTLYTEAGVLPDRVLRAGESDVTIQLGSGLTVRGRVTDENGVPFAQDPSKQIYVSAQRPNQWLRSARVDDEGYFELKMLPPGPITLTAYVPDHGNAILEVEAGEQSARLTVQRKPSK